MKKILLLGGSAQQVIAIEKSKSLGLYTILCDYLPDNPGQYVADKYYNVSTTDIESVYLVAQKEKVDGILAYASDPAAYTASVVAERLGLPTNSSKTISVLSEKHSFREFLKTNGFACPRNFSFSFDISKSELEKKIQLLHLPIIIKPTDSSGSKGVTKLDSFDKLEQAVRSASQYSRNKILIAEEYINRGFPNIIGGDIFVWDGKIILFGEMSCLRDFSGKGLLPVGKIKPSGLSQLQTKIVQAELQRLVTALDLQFGEMNLELILDKENKVHFLELGPRAGGNMIPIQLSDALGVDLVNANVLASIGDKPDLNPIEQDGCYMHYVLHSYKEGIFSDVLISNRVEAFVYRKIVYKKPGDHIEYFDGAGKAIGIIFLKFPSHVEMSDFCQNRDSYVKILLK